MKIAIIGAGVSGLSLAYYLQKFKQEEMEITIYEQAERIGGNAFTQELNLSCLKRPDTWVDMGVNDFNINTYNAMLELWDEIGLPQNEYVGTLVNDASFFYYGDSPQESYGFKMFLKKHEVCQKVETEFLGHNLKDEVLEKIKQGFEDFEKFLKLWFKEHEDQPTAFKITVEQFIYKYFKDIAYKPFVEMALIPRINAMFFSYEESPVGRPPVLDMPMWLVSHYYVLQEGLALPPCREDMRESQDQERKFFNKGCQKWLEFLGDKLIKQFRVKLICGVSGIKVFRHGEGAYIYSNFSDSAYYDKVIFCTPAYEVERITDPSTFGADDLLQKTKQFRYVPCIVYANYDSNQVPPLEEFICAYNVRIYDYKSYSLSSEETEWPAFGMPSGMFKPYHMTYSANKHQPQADYQTSADFYVSVNPLNSSSQEFLKHSLWQTNGARAQALFYHCKFTPAALKAQEDIQRTQIGIWNPKQDYGDEYVPVLPRTFYLAGNYCNGAGLHTECILFSKDLAQKIINPSFVSSNFYDYEGVTNRHPVPAYMREVLRIS